MENNGKKRKFSEEELEMEQNMEGDYLPAPELIASAFLTNPIQITQWLSSGLIGIGGLGKQKTIKISLNTTVKFKRKKRRISKTT
jgi:hypothetical protein